MERLHEAARLFPFSPQIRRGPADETMVARNEIDPAFAAREIAAALARDPNAADLLAAQVVFSSGSGDTMTAISAAKRFLALAPRSARAAGLLAFLAAPALAGPPPSQYTLTLTPADIQELANALGVRPYLEVRDLLARIQRQIDEQAAAAAAAKAKE